MLILLGLYEILKQNLNDLESIIFPSFFFFLRIGEQVFYFPSYYLKLISFFKNLLEHS